MTQDEIIRMAREAGLIGNDEPEGAIEQLMRDCIVAALPRFAALAVAHEREACAKVCEEYTGSAQTCAAAIRVRGDK